MIAEEPEDTPSASKAEEEARPEPQEGDTVKIERQRLTDKSKEELIQIIQELAAELKTRTQAFETTKLAASGVPKSFVEAGVETYVRLPAFQAKEGEDRDGTPWRVQLFSSNPNHKPLGIELHGEIIIGRSAGGMVLDLDLSPYDAEMSGVSRRHARLRPADDGLFLTDMNSTNGTFCNGTRLQPLVSQKVIHNDTLSFGRLHFKLKIISQPGKPAS